MKVSLTKDDLAWAAEQGLLTRVQSEALWTALAQRAGGASSAASVAYYVGAMIVVAAMGWLMAAKWESLGGIGILLLASLYATLFAAAGAALWFRERLREPGGLLVTAAVCMTPLIVYGAQKMLGWWPLGPTVYPHGAFWSNGSWVVMELSTAFAGLLALRFVRFPFLAAPITVSLWLMCMELTPLFFPHSGYAWRERPWVSLAFGLVVLVVAYLLDRRTRVDYSHWLYIFGMCAFWGGLTLTLNDSEGERLAYCMINAAMIAASIFLDRRVFLLFGALGVNGYLAHLAYLTFRNSAIFPMALVALGVLIIFLGVLYQKNRTRMDAALANWLPDGLRELRPANRVPS